MAQEQTYILRFVADTEEAKRFVKEFQAVGGTVEKVTDSMKRSASGVKVLGVNISELVKRAAFTIPVWLALRTAVNSVIGSFKDGAQRASELSLALAKAQTVAQGQVTNFAAFRQEVTKLANSLGGELGVSAVDVVKTFERIVSTGLAVEDSLGATAAVVKLATVQQTDLSEVADQLANTFEIFGDTLESTIPVQERYLLAAAKIKKLDETNSFTLKQLAEGFANVQATAKGAGFSFDQTVTLLAALNSAGLKGAKAGTLLSTAISKLTSNMSTLSTELDIHLSKQDKLPEILIKTITEMKRLIDAGKEFEAQKLFEKIFGGERGGKAIRPLIEALNTRLLPSLEAIGTEGGQSFEKIQSLQTNFQKSVDDTTAVLGGQAKRFTELKTQAAAAFFAGLTGGESLATTLRTINDLIKQNIDNFELFGRIIANIPTLGIIDAKQSTDQEAIANKTLKDVQDLQKALSNPIDTKNLDDVIQKFERISVIRKQFNDPKFEQGAFGGVDIERTLLRLKQTRDGLREPISLVSPDAVERVAGLVQTLQQLKRLAPELGDGFRNIGKLDDKGLESVAKNVERLKKAFSGGLNTDQLKELIDQIQLLQDNEWTMNGPADIERQFGGLNLKPLLADLKAIQAGTKEPITFTANVSSKEVTDFTQVLLKLKTLAPEIGVNLENIQSLDFSNLEEAKSFVESVRLSLSGKMPTEEVEAFKQSLRQLIKEQDRLGAAGSKSPLGLNLKALLNDVEKIQARIKAPIPINIQAPKLPPVVKVEVRQDDSKLKEGVVEETDLARLRHLKDELALQRLQAEQLDRVTIAREKFAQILEEEVGRQQASTTEAEKQAKANLLGAITIAAKDKNLRELVSLLENEKLGQEIITKLLEAQFEISEAELDLEKQKKDIRSNRNEAKNVELEAQGTNKLVLERLKFQQILEEEVGRHIVVTDEASKLAKESRLAAITAAANVGNLELMADLINEVKHGQDAVNQLSQQDLAIRREIANLLQQEKQLRSNRDQLQILELEALGVNKIVLERTKFQQVLEEEVGRHIAATNATEELAKQTILANITAASNADQWEEVNKQIILAGGSQDALNKLSQQQLEIERARLEQVREISATLQSSTEGFLVDALKGSDSALSDFGNRLRDTVLTAFAEGLVDSIAKSGVFKIFGESIFGIKNALAGTGAAITTASAAGSGLYQTQIVTASTIGSQLYSQAIISATAASTASKSAIQAGINAGLIQSPAATVVGAKVAGGAFGAGGGAAGAGGLSALMANPIVGAALLAAVVGFSIYQGRKAEKKTLEAQGIRSTTTASDQNAFGPGGVFSPGGVALISKAIGRDLDAAQHIGKEGRRTQPTSFLGPAGLLFNALTFKSSAVRTTVEEFRVASKIDVTNNQLQIVNRNLVALKSSVETFILPNSAFFSERRGELEGAFSISARRGI